MPNDRRDPDELLRRMEEEAAQARRGKLRIFFGFAPGVGKTYRMLQVARELAGLPQRDRAMARGIECGPSARVGDNAPRVATTLATHTPGTALDVVIGVVETHQRVETTALTEGLPTLPRKSITYRGHTLDEFDLDAALARHPSLLLVDELAHTNAPGSRHPKRWQDVLELLDAGIDVFTTLNVQHIESLNDVVSQITSIQVRETVPDSILERADAIEVIDIAPEDLLQRLQEGKVYVPERAARAIQNFFQRGNLLALRELALRRTAQHVDEDVQEYREQHGVRTTWPAGERILVCVGPAPSSGRLIRSAARMAAGLRCPWVAAYVERTGRTVAGADRERLEAHLRVVESLGGTVTRLSGFRVAESILEYARRTNVTRIIIGKPTHPRIRDRLGGSLLDEVVRGSGDIDVHVISGAEVDTPNPQPARAPQRTARPADYAVALLIVGVGLALAWALRTALNLPDPEMMFLISVIVTAMVLGRGPALFAAALSVACYDFFFVPPLYQFDVDDRRHVLTFATLFGVGLLLSELAGRLRRQERDAVSREERTAVLYTLSRDLAVADQAAQIAQVAARHAADVFQARVAILQGDGDGDLHTLATWPADTLLDAKDLSVAKWTFEHGEPAGLGTDTLPGSAVVCAPLRVASTIGVLALRSAQQTALRAEQRAFLDVFCRQIAAALERVRLASEARASALRAKSEQMRSSLLSAVSHDLRTPLGSITGAASSLRDDPNLSAETRAELTDSIVDEAARLERLVANLLDMTRLESGAISLRRDWVPLEECIGSALTRLEARLGVRTISVRLEPDLPLVLVDPVLVEQLFVNLLENSAKYTPEGSPIDISARRATAGADVIVEVIDHGPGLPPGSDEKVFDKFFRGDHAGISGAGLGLAICRGIVEAHGGTIRAERRPGAGAVFCVTLPIGGEPPALPQGDGAAA